MIQSVMAICSALAAVESQEITGALNQLPPCPSRMQPKIQKVRSKNERQRKVEFSLNIKMKWKGMRTTVLPLLQTAEETIRSATVVMCFAPDVV